MQRATYKISAAVGCSCPVPAPDADSLPLPPDYWSDLEHWLKTLAPAKPDDPPCGTIRTHGNVKIYTSSLSNREPTADMWHSEAPSVPGVYIASAERCKDVLSYWDGSKWHCGAGNAGDARKQTPRKAFPVEWLRLIEADAPAKPLPSASSFASTSSAVDGAALVGAKLTHSVCIKAHHGVEVGRVVDGSRPLAYPKCWLPCVEDGWIPHTPTADSVCPVPDGVRFEARYGDGTPVDDTESTKHGDCIILWRATTGSAPCNDIVAWRPIAKDA